MSQTQAAIGIIRRDGRCFAQRRALDAAVLPGFWEFPGGKLEPLETPREALLRELEEETGYRPERVEALPTLCPAYGEVTVLLHPFLCGGPGQPRTALAWGWFTPAELALLPMLPVNAAILPWLLP